MDFYVRLRLRMRCAWVSLPDHDSEEYLFSCLRVTLPWKVFRYQVTLV